MRQRSQRRAAWWLMLAAVVLPAAVRLVPADDPPPGTRLPRTRTESKARTSARAETTTGYQLTAKFLVVPFALRKQLELDSKSMRTIEVPPQPGAQKISGQADALSAEESFTRRICDVLDEKREQELAQWIGDSPESRMLGESPVEFRNGESVEVPLPAELTASGGGLRVRYSRSTDIDNCGQLKFWITTPRYKVKSAEGAAEEFKRWRMEGARQLKAGEKLLLAIALLHPQSPPSELLLAQIEVKKTEVPLERNNAAADSTAEGKPDKRRLVTISYPVSDLVTPVPARSRINRDLSVNAEPVTPRFDPLVHLLESTVSPELWDDPRKSGCTIRAFPQGQSLVIRAEQTTHDRIADRLEQLRAEQNRRLIISVRLITAEDVQRWYDYWNTLDVEGAAELAAQLESTDLAPGVIVNRDQAVLIKDLVRKQGLVSVHQTMISRVFLNRQSAEFDFSEFLKSAAPLKCQIQLRPVIQSQGQVLVALSVNPDRALDPLSHVKSGTIPAEHALLVDVTDQMTGEGPVLLPYQLQRQLPDAAGEGKRYLLLVEPSEVSQFTPRLLTSPSR